MYMYMYYVHIQPMAHGMATNYYTYRASMYMYDKVYKPLAVTNLWELWGWSGSIRRSGVPNGG